MQEYRAYILGPDGHVQRQIDLVADEKAKERAKHLVDGNAVELWQERRKIATFTPSSKDRPRGRWLTPR